MKTSRWINRIAAVLAVVAIAAGVGLYALASMDSGVRVGINGQGQAVVTGVLPFSPASMGYGMATPNGGTTAQLLPGMVVTELNGTTLIRLPQVVYADPPPTPDPATGIAPGPQPIGVDPPVPTATVSDAQLRDMVTLQVAQIQAISPGALAAWDPNTSTTMGWGFWWTFGRRILVLLAAGAIGLPLGALWLASGRGGRGLQSMAVPAALAVAGPLVLAPLEASASLAGLAGYSLLMPLTLVPLALALLLRVEGSTERLLATLAAAACGASAVAIGIVRITAPLGADQVVPISVLAAGISAVPGLAAAASRRKPSSDVDENDRAEGSRRVARGAAYVVAGLTPLFAIQTAIGPYWPVLPIWLAVVWIAGRLTVRPLVRLAGRAQLQRDLVVAATEAERARVAADIHDDALQELTLLVRRLDAAGDTEGADMARGISDRLRAICGDLRLPILDDLGIGPALDWLVIRIERLAGGEVRLERADGSRPPAEVELAFFRVAQEALSNAVRHGRPPIVVRYRSDDGYATLSIDDAGAGIAPNDRDRAEADGHHYGLLNMAQRAEGIGAILDIRRWPAGGTHVGLEWRAR